MIAYMKLEGLSLKRGYFLKIFNFKTDYWTEDLVSLMIKLWDLACLLPKNAPPTPKTLSTISEYHLSHWHCVSQRFLECKYTVASHGFNSELPFHNSFIMPTIEARLWKAPIVILWATVNVWNNVKPSSGY